MTKKFKTYEEAAKHLDEIDQSNFGQLSLTNPASGMTIAHVLAFSNRLMEKFITPEVLKLAKTSDGWTVAHMLALRNNLPEKFITPDILKLARKKDGWTVAHELAFNNKLKEKFISPDILKLARVNDGLTVAHILVTKNKLPKKYTTPGILLLKSNDGYVYEKLPKYKDLTFDSVKNALDLYLLAMTKYRYPKVSFEKFKGLIDKYGLDKMKQIIKLTGKKDD